MRTRGTVQRNRLGATLIERGLIDEPGLERALAMQRELGQRLGTNLLELGLVSESELLHALGALRHTQVVTAQELRHIPAEIIRLVPPKLAKRYRIVPVKRSGGTLLIASLDPGEALIEDEIGSLTSRLTRTVMGLEARMYEALERYYQVPASVRTKALVQRLESSNDDGDLLAGDHWDEPDAGEAATPESLPESTPGLTSEAPAALATSSPVAATPSVNAASSGSPDADSPTQEPRAKVPERPLFIELPEEERALIYGKRREEALSRDPRASSDRGDRAASIVDPSSERDRGFDHDPDRASDPPAGAEEAPSQPTPKVIPSTPDRGASPSLEVVSEALQRVEIRDDIADQILAFAGGYFSRRLLFMQRKDRILGWRGDGPGITPQVVRSLDMPADEASVFKNLMAGLERWRGPLPPFPAHDPIVHALGHPSGPCLVLPIRLRERVVSFLYVDNEGGTLDNAPLDDLERLAQKAGVALEVIILKNKIRVL